MNDLKRLCFLGLKESFDYFHIGGTESFVRRIATQTVQNGINVDYILYGDKEDGELSPVPCITLKYFKSFEDALDVIDEKYEHVITIYLQSKDRLRYAFFRRRASEYCLF